MRQPPPYRRRRPGEKSIRQRQREENPPPTFGQPAVRRGTHVMKLNQNLDMSHDSLWLKCRPSPDVHNLMLQVREAGHFYAGNNFFTEREGLREYFLLYTVGGGGVLRHLGQKHILSRHDAVLFCCEERQFFGSISEEVWDHYWVRFTGSDAPGYFNIINTDGIAKLHIEDPETMTEHFDGILSCSGDLDISGSIRSSMYLTNLLAMLAIAKHAVRDLHPLTEHEDALNRAITFIEDNYADSVALKDMVSVANMSTSYFTKLFRQHTGMTPHEYLINYRVSQAKKALRRTTESVGQVAARVGFQDVCSFTRAFRRITGTTPRDFRRTGEQQ